MTVSQFEQAAMDAALKVYREQNALISELWKSSKPPCVIEFSQDVVFYIGIDKERSQLFIYDGVDLVLRFGSPGIDARRIDSHAALAANHIARTGAELNQILGTVRNG